MRRKIPIISGPNIGGEFHRQDQVNVAPVSPFDNEGRGFISGYVGQIKKGDNSF